MRPESETVIVFGCDMPTHLLLYFDTNLRDDFYTEVHKRNFGAYKKLLYKPDSLLHSNEGCLMVFKKDYDYNFEDCLRIYCNKFLKTWWRVDCIHFPIYIIKDEWFYIIEDDSFLMRKWKKLRTS